MKKLAVVGKGTVGCFAIGYFLKHTAWDIEWIFDSNIPPTAVGEGTTAVVPSFLNKAFGWGWTDLHEIDGSVKTGIYKQSWGTSTHEFIHPFPVDVTGVHFNAIQLQNKVFAALENNPRVTFTDSRVDNPHELDADYVIMCSGTPVDFSEYNIHSGIPTNSAYVTQCYWDHPRFNHTLTIARPYGWVFGIPLQNRCSIGYIYNKDITPLSVIKEDVTNVFDQYNLTPSTTTNSLSFNNYSRKNNFTDKVVYNGNASFFLEPLEATSTSLALFVNRTAFNLWHRHINKRFAERSFQEELSNIESMISLHYMAGSSFDSSFWDYAKDKGYSKIQYNMSSNTPFADNLVKSIDQAFNPKLNDVGTWPRKSYYLNTLHLGIQDRIKQMVQAT